MFEAAGNCPVCKQPIMRLTTHTLQAGPGIMAAVGDVTVTAFKCPSCQAVLGIERR